MREQLTLHSTWIKLLLFAFVVLSTQQSYAQDDQPYQGVAGKTLAESKEWWPKQVKAPKGAPNIVWILLDDVGFGASGTFGGLINTPTAWPTTGSGTPISTMPAYALPRGQLCLPAVTTTL